MAVASRVGSIFRRIGGGIVSLGGLLRGMSLILAGVGVLALIAAAPLYLLVPELKNSAVGLAAVGVLFLLVALMAALSQVRTALLGRRGRYGSNTVVMVVAFVGIAVALNLLGVRQSYRVDLTVNREFSLSAQTVKVLKDLSAPVHAVGFFSPVEPYQETAENQLREYVQRSPRLTYEIVDPDVRPSVARQYEVKQYNVVVFESEGRRASVPAAIEANLPDANTGQLRPQVVPNPVLEQDFTTALLKVTGKQQQVVYYLIGHDELRLDSDQATGFAMGRVGLERDLYAVATLSLDSAPEVPADAAAVIVAGPKKPLPERDRAMLDAYLKGGGNLVFLGEPGLSSGWSELLASWGLSVSQRQIIEEQRFVQPDKAMPAAWEFQYASLLPDMRFVSHPITEPLDVTFFPGVASLKVDLPEDQKNITVFPLIRTTAQSKLDGSETDTGPFMMGVTLEGFPLDTTPVEGKKHARLVIFGDSDFASNAYFSSRSNGDLFINSVNWVTEREELISIRPKPYAFRRLVVTQRAWNWILYSSVAFLPLLVAGVGAFTWWRRR
ncbi:MAG: GldG family protein [Chloroflexi bacterium]|nr:GldG family protein [Chloroflexota bacterium]